MADLVITAANVVPVADGSTFRQGYAGEVVSAGMPVYLHAASNTLRKAKANTTAAEAVVSGIACHDAEVGQPLTIIVAGDIGLGAVLLAGKYYVLSGAAAGGIAPVADLTTGWRSSLLGYATTTSNLKVNILNTAVAVA